MLTFSEVRELNQRSNVIPLVTRVPSDVETPVTAWLKLCRNSRYGFLLESVEGGEKLARYSFLGRDPFLVVQGWRNRVRLLQGKHAREIEALPIPFLAELFAAYRPATRPDLPRFTGGGVGYFSYDSVRWNERIPDRNPDQLGLPEMQIGLYRDLIVFDHLRQEIVLIANILHDVKASGLRDAYNDGRRRLETMIAHLGRPIRSIPSLDPVLRSQPRVNIQGDDFKRLVTRAKRHIREGDVFQVVLSRRWEINHDVNPLTIYRRLRRRNPSPYLFLLRLGEASVIGSSPEMMVRVEGKRIETRPIAGTRPRGESPDADQRLANDLLADPKERAEHTMLIDLGRNDVGRVARAGSVNVPELMTIERYSHVMHIVSSVTGQLRRDVSPIDAHFACFPAGTLSGAPKIRAMEIIDDLEPVRRGIYGGSIGYIDFWGNLDSCIAIRTVVQTNGSSHIQAGAGIVADSRPTREVEETEAKAESALRAVTGRGDS